MGVATQVASLYGDLSLRDTLTGGMKKAERSFKSVGKSMRKAGQKLTLGLSIPLLALGGLAVNTAIQWEDAFAGVVKTVDGTAEELAVLEMGLRDLATSADSPVSSLENAHLELAGVAEAAGQLGVALPDILTFTETMGMLGMATDLTAENAAFMSAQFANITGMDFSEIDRFGATIVALGNNSATTESAILEMASRLAGIGATAGFSEAEIVGLAAAMSSMGINAEAGGTAMTTVISKIITAVATGNGELETFAELAGLTADEFATAWEEEPIEALTAFIDGLGDLDSAARESKLEELGLDGIRVADVLRRMSGNSELLTDTLEIGIIAWRDNNALVDEASTRAQTTRGQINKLKNNVNELATSLGERLLPRVNDFVTGATGIVTQLNKANPAIWDAVLAVGALLIVAGPATTAIGLLAGAIAFLLTPIGLALLAVVLLGAAWATNFGGMRDWVDSLRQSLDEKDVEGVIYGIGDAVNALPRTIVGAKAWEEGVEGWRTTWESLKQIIIWIGEQTGGILGAINFVIPGDLREMLGIVTQIADKLGFISTLRGLISEPSQPGAFVPDPAAAGAVGTVEVGSVDGRALGGSVSAMTPYLVGERGPELFVPSTGGQIVPNHGLGGGGMTRVIVQLGDDVLYDAMHGVADRRGEVFAVVQ